MQVRRVLQVLQVALIQVALGRVIQVALGRVIQVALYRVIQVQAIVLQALVLPQVLQALIIIAIAVIPQVLQARICRIVQQVRHRYPLKALSPQVLTTHKV